MMKLYWAPRTRSLRALWLLEEAGVPYERIRLDLSAGEQKSAEFRAIKPRAKVPAVTVLDRSAAPPVVLIVEDEMFLRMRAVDMVEDAGYTSVEAVDAGSATSKSNIRGV